MIFHLFVVVLLSGVSNVADGAGTLRFADYYENHMVLQMEPARAQIWGYASTVGDTVTIKLNWTVVSTVTVTKRNQGQTGGIWSALLPAQKACGPVTIDIISNDGHATLSDILFGDVWICSGQSNMEFAVGQIYSVFFRFVPHVFAEELSPHVNRPIGLIQTAWGGTLVEAWSSPYAFASYTHKTKRAIPRVLWNAMVSPLLDMTIYGVIWYQGEANIIHPDAYACQFLAMIYDWRSKFNAGSQHQTDKQFPFGFVQLAPEANFTNHFGFPDLRWSQTAKYGYVPNPRLQSVFIAVAMDLPDFKSTFGSIHPRDKQDVAKRLALAGRAVTYNENNLDFQGPIPTDLTLIGNKLVIEFDHGNSAIEVRKTDGFELCCGSAINHKCHFAAWTPAPIVAHNQSTVTIDTSGCHGNTNVVAAVRYAWEMSPCEFMMCPLYDSTNDLPAATFVKYAPFNMK